MVCKMDMRNEQKKVCLKYNAPYHPCDDSLKLGIATNVKAGILPINGLRITPEGDTTGWYIWAGEELSQEPDFFHPLHVEHLKEWRPEIEKYLGLPPGWRFLIADNYEDIWFDESLL